jgi:hypothetical protein
VTVAQILGNLAGRVAGAGFGALLGRWVGPQVVNYIAARVTYPLILPLAGVALAAAGVNAVQNRLLANYPAVRGQLGVALNGAVFVSSGLAVSLAVIYFVTWNNQGPINTVITAVTAAVRTTPGLTLNEFIALGG